jgi:endonuclease/exonuclease/phosphatase family metal-dependent hydrolase
MTHTRPQRCRAPFVAALRLLPIILAMLSACVRVPPPASPRPASPLRVMTYNIRYDNAGDGVNAWPNRKDRVAALVRYHQADVVGVQEALVHQLTDLDARLPGFARVGVGRRDGKQGGEFSPILYRTDRLALEDSGTFWLSPTPESPGSKGWDTAIERVATWARFRDRESGCRWIHLNTHFDHVGEIARQEGARLIRRRLATLANGLPIVLTGDLNTEPTQPPYRILTRDTLDGAIAPLRDAYVASRSGHYGPIGTWNAFKAIEENRRIDYVMVSTPIVVDGHATLSDRWDDRFPSDHLPVIATLNRFCR